MSEVLIGKSVYAYLQDDAARLLEGVRAYANKLRICELPWLERGNSCLVFPWTGSKGMQTLYACAVSEGIKVEMESVSLTYRCDSGILTEHLTRVAEGCFDVETLATSITNKYKDKFDRYLSAELLDFANARRLLSLDDAIEAAKGILGRC